MQLPIKVLKDKDQNPFIPFVTTSSVVENGTNRNLDDILHNLTVPVTNLNSLENTAVADMMTNMKDYKDSGFAIIYVNTDNTGLLLAFEKITTVDVLNKCWSFVSSFNADSKAYRINITGYYNADNSVFTVSSAAIEELKQKSNSNIYELPVQYASPSWFALIPKQDCSAVINKIIQDGVENPVIRLVTTEHHSDYREQAYFDFIYNSDRGPISSTRNYYYFVCYGYVTVTGAPSRPENMYINYSNLTISGTWTDGVFTCTNVSGYSYFKTSLSKFALTDNVLTKTNTTAFTPTKPYHPSTKQYVDNLINTLPKTQDLVDNGFVYDTGTTESVEINTTVTNISTTYGFALNANGYYESTNKGKSSSWALCKVTINAPNPFTLTIPYISYGESGYDYGIFGQLDTELANSYADDGATGSAKVKLNCKGQASADVKQVSYDVPAGEHFIEIKYRKDNGGNQGNDSLQFKIDATFSIEQEIFVNKKLATTDILNTLPTMPVYYISAYNVMGTDVDITDAETLAQVNEIINSNYGKDVLLCIKDKTYKGYYMFLIMFWNKPKTSYTNTYKTFSTISLIQTEDSHRALTVLPMKFTYNSVAGESITVTHIKYDTFNGNKKNEYILLEKFYTRIPGYNSSKTQVLKNVNGTLKWVTEEVI